MGTARSQREEKLLEDILTKLDNPSDPALVDLVDKWARLVGKIDIQRFLGSDISLTNPIYNAIVFGGAVIDPRDVSDRAARLLGVVYGSQGQQLLQRATTYDLIVQLRSAGVEIDPRVITDIEKVASVTKYLAPTSLAAGGTATLWTPAADKKIRFKRVQVSVDAATRIDLRWGTTAFESYYLPANGSVVFNAIGVNEEGAVDESLTLLSSAAANVTASAKGDEI